MKTHLLRRLFAQLILLFAAGLFLAGCAATPKVDWNSRVGNYTYDQAVAELGPPDKSAKLSDGQTVAEWITAHRQNSSVSVGTGIGVGFGGIGVGQTFGGGSSEKTLRLNFDVDGRLASWKTN
jgi:hypothetical protein